MTYANLQRQLVAVYQQSALWTLTVPGDAANGLTSTSWTPVVAEIARHTGTGASADQKRAVYTQALELLKQSQALAMKTTSLGPTERATFTGLLHTLMQDVTKSLNAI